ncbi:MAG: sigma-54 dependent transcriptional regulator [candidate division KSB1 bacterium]|nr:sigma-54 dependent transcriptional regulator [candidate division KSB1 bacterium]
MMNPGPKPRILIADDDASVRESLKIILQEQGNFDIVLAETGRHAWEQLQSRRIDVALLDLMFDDLSGLDILSLAQEQRLDTEIILITGRGTIETAVEAMRRGAFDYLTKPVDGQEIQRVLKHALEKRALVDRTRSLETQLAGLSRYEGLLGKSAAMQQLYRTLESVAPTDASVFITGESGTGKELVARAIHNKSRRVRGPFVAVNCAALPANILESELFGHVRGAFTGAIRDRTGYFEQADGGTLFLDEIAEMPIELQAKLLRVLETQSFRRVGGQKDTCVDVRIIAATNQPARAAIDERRLREDLYYRLAVIEIELPPLRQRREDIPIIAQAFLTTFAEAVNKPIRSISTPAMQRLLNYPWPGNVRELRNAIERAVILCHSEQIEPDDLPPALNPAGAPVPAPQPDGGDDLLVVPLGTPLADVEKQLILRTLKKWQNNKTHTARVLGISLKTLHNKLARYQNE